MTSPEKKADKSGQEVLNVGEVVMPDGKVIDLSKRSCNILKDPPILTLKSTKTTKKIGLLQDEAARITMGNHLKVRSLTILTSTTYYIMFDWHNFPRFRRYARWKSTKLNTS